MKAKGKSAKVLPRTHFGNPILRQKAHPVKFSFITSMQFPRLVQDMFHTMRRAYGVGLAAPQIGLPYQLAVIEIPLDKVASNLEENRRFVVINPKILSHGTKKAKAWEGCLSLPAVRGVVPRYHRIKVRYMNEQGKTVTLECEGFLARVFQHEVDHLNGALYVDHMTDMKTLSTEEEYLERVLKNKGK